MPIAGAIIPAIIGAGASIFGATKQSSAAQTAAQQQQQAQQKVIDNTTSTVANSQNLVNNATTAGQQGIAAGAAGATGILSDAEKQQLALLLPYIQSGGTSLTSLQSLAGDNGPLSQKFSFNPTDLQSDPGYQFTLQQGQQAIQRSAAAQGGLFSGGTLKSLAGYTTGTANTYFNDAFNRAQSTFNTNRQSTLDRINTLQGLANFGYGATNTGSNVIGSTGTQQANIATGAADLSAGLGLQGATTAGGYGLAGSKQIADALTNQGNSAAAGTVGSSNAVVSGVNGVANTLINLIPKIYRPGSSTNVPGFGSDATGGGVNQGGAS